ncbi:MAG TPA: SPOR domain-containing protein [Caulobacteraceae bacterium]
MTDPDRGAYTPPTDAPLAFDARRPSGGGRRPVPVSLVLTVLVLAALIGAVFWFYRSGVRGAGDAPQPVGTPLGEITAPAPNEAQPVDPAAGLEIYKSDDLTVPETPTFAPPPEQPKPRPQPTTPVQAQEIPPPLKIAPGSAAPSPNPQVVALEPKPAAPAPKPTAPAQPATNATGAFAVQIGALSSPALADKAYSQAVAIGGGGHGKSVTEVTVNGSTLYRTAVTGFATRDAASAFCDKLKAAGKSCFVR